MGAARSPSGSSAARLNVSYNCLDRHVEAGRGDKVAYHWEGEPGDTRTITYADLLDEVSRFANVLKGLGVERGDRVAIYMPMIPELPVAMLACTRIGAAHSVHLRRLLARLDHRPGQRRRGQGHRHRRRRLPPGRGGAAQAERRRGASPPRPSVTARRGRAAAPDSDVDDGRRAATTGTTSSWPTPSADCPPEHMDSEDLLYLLYTSGTTAKPKGIMHTTGGYLTQVAFTHKYVFDLHPEPTSTGARPTSAGSPATATSSTARSTNGATSVHLRGHARHARPATGCGRSSSATA